jgi:hypothetical protein
MDRILPPGMSPDTFDRVLKELAVIVGSSNVSTDASHGALEGPHQAKSYGDPYAMWPGARREASGAVRPSSVSEIQ